MKYTVTLPYPVSANTYWRSFPHPATKRVVTTLSREAKAYKTEVAWRVKAAGIREPIAGRVAVHIQLYPQRPKDADKRAAKDPMNWDDDVRCLDLDNARKVLYDALKNIAFEDDARIFRDSAERMEPDGEGRVVVTIEPIVRVSPQGELLAACDRIEANFKGAVDAARRMGTLAEKPF